ncbi:amino acid synthesis family protein [Roseomonas sp. PWR1]|uniref:Amino acid synthesis family protein n=1 Tax=Roseomonas nitratireducens TaxID=2820810 RepID=A0ABS4AT28_9PROT|nr:amino acid synthesis family protein [Neoroseomonas nitratireducens]MBP0464513.1 amino acid synthesis family protein [Neoroseomonas nitratireducens]
MVAIRKIALLREQAFSDMGQDAARPVVRAVALIAIANPFAGRFVRDLAELVEAGGALSARVAPDLLRMLDGPPVAYGKGAIVGTAGEIEHGHALLHPKMGAPLRAAIGGGAALIPSAAKMGAPGTALDLPLGHKDDAWSRGHFDAITVMLGDAPRAEEILVAIALADGGRVLHRI